MATILIGYDTETAAVGEALARMTASPNFPLYELALDPNTCRRAIAHIREVHEDAGVPATLFVCGRTLLHAVDALYDADRSGLFDIQQHTFSHVPFKEIEYAPTPDSVARIPAAPAEALREELAFTSRLLLELLGRDCIGLRTPFGYYRGLRDRADLLQIVRDSGLRYITSWGRNEHNENPTPWVQPFAYVDEGYPDIVELPFQFWLDVVWFDTHGYDTGPQLLEALRGAVDQVAEQDLVYGACFHDWVMLASREQETGWLRGFLAYADECGVEVTTYTDYWRRIAAES
jgi:peptidoglycan/xylan/chitin deacetylase (PgdA/CDA1 family)